MPEYPKSNSQSDNSNKAVSFSMNVPTYHSIHTNYLVGNGWLRVGNDYHKDGVVLKYTGTWWEIGLIRFRWVEQLTEYLTNGKLPEE